MAAGVLEFQQVVLQLQHPQLNWLFHKRIVPCFGHVSHGIACAIGDYEANTVVMDGTIQLPEEMKMITRNSLTILGVALPLVFCSFLVAGEPDAYGEISRHYEAIRQILLHDGTDGVVGHAAEIREAVSTLKYDFDAATASVPTERSAACLELLPAIESSAAALEASRTLDDARGAFGELSRQMVRYREMASDPRSVVVYCAMAEKVWVQPRGEIGNPYYGQNMARCGKIVSE